MRDVIAAEWLKTRSLRSTWWALALTAAVVIGSAAVAAHADYVNFPSYSLEEQRTHGFALGDAFPLAGYLVLVVVAASAGASAMISEYSSGLLRVTAVAVPARSELLAAKAVVAAAVWTVAGALTSLTAFAVSQLILAGRDANASLTGPGTATALLAATLIGPVCALVGLALAVLLRHAGTVYVTGILLLVLAPQLLSTRQNVTRELHHTMLIPAWQRLTEAYGPPRFLGSLYTSAVEAWLAYAIWSLIFIAAALVVHRRRDL
ncbi:ABC transporter permease subunit [Actinoplanes sp. CA-142083]|uniref:ABC transporter permease subunit n=1 Tax=Actinoplanes sp. CA-142083 TaxID=3239903 RepID=UPI003D90093A